MTSSKTRSTIRPGDEFWVVTEPTTDSLIADICFETTIEGLRRQLDGGLDPKEVTILFDSATAHKIARARIANHERGES